MQEARLTDFEEIEGLGRYTMQFSPDGATAYPSHDRQTINVHDSLVLHIAVD
jgi:hypothetical protein